MIYRKTFHRIIGTGIRCKRFEYDGWYLFGIVPLYVDRKEYKA